MKIRDHLVIRKEYARSKNKTNKPKQQQPVIYLASSYTRFELGVNLDKRKEM